MAGDFALRVKRFLGVNLKADPADMNTHECQQCDGFDVSVKPGALIKRKGITDQASVSLPASYPSSWTIKNFFQFRVTKPSAQNIMVVHATVGGEDRVYVDYTYNGSSWVQGWVELTENEEALTADAGTNTTTIVDAGLASSTNDYYNGWYIFNFTRGLGSLVSDYDGGTKTLTLKTVVTSQTTGDTYSMWRFPMVVLVEGNYTSDLGSSTTQTIDLSDYSSEYYELHNDFDDAYNGWVLGNITENDTGSVSDYVGSYAGNKRQIIHTAISTDATDGDTYWLYKTTRALSVDDKIQFRQRPNTLIMACGNTSRLPIQFPMWYGYIRSNYYFGDSGNSINAGYYLEPAILDAPDDGCLQTVVADTEGSDFLDASTATNPYYFYALAYVYDGYQVGPLTSAARSEALKLAGSGSNWHVVTLRIGYSKQENMRHSFTLNKRVTAVEVYMSNDFDVSQGSGAWYRIVRIPIRQDFDYGFGGTRPVHQNIANQKSYGFVGNAIASVQDFGRLQEDKVLQELQFNWTGSDPYTYTLNVYGTTWDNKGFPYSFAAGGIAGDIINYAVGDETKNHAIVGKLFTGESEDSLIAYSPMKPDSTPSPDYLPAIMVQDMARNGIFSVTDVKIIGDKVYIIGASKSLRMAMNSGAVPTFRVDAEFDYVGSEAVNGTLKIRDGVVTVSKKGVYFFDNIEHYMSAQIEDTSSLPLGMTTMSEAYIGYNAVTSDIYIVFPTDSKLFSYNLNTKQWVIHSVGVAVKALVTGDDGEIYGASSGKIFRLDNGTSDDSKVISPTWKSKVYNMDAPDLEKVLNWVEISYRSDTAIQFDVFINRSASVASWAAASDNQLASSSTVTTARLLFPSTFRGYEFEFKFSLPSGVTTNTYFEVHEFNVLGTVEERIS